MSQHVEEVHLWRCVCPAPHETVAEFTLTLSIEELRRAGNYRQSIDRERFITSRGALRRILSSYVNILPSKLKFQSGIFGKPRLERGTGGNVPFNLSRAGRRALIAVAPGMAGEIGVDLVKIESVPTGPINGRVLVADHFPRHDKAGSSAGESERIFARLWAQSEAILKARGTGVGDADAPAELCALDKPMNEWRALNDRPEPGRLLCELELMEGYAAALAVPGPMREIRVRVFDFEYKRPAISGVREPLEAGSAAP